MPDITHALTDFCLGNSVPGMEYLTSAPDVPKSLKGTNLDFILRVGMEGKRILRYAAPALESPSFGAEEPRTILIGWDAARSALMKGGWDRAARREMAAVVPALFKISHHYARQTFISGEAWHSAARQFQSAQQEVTQAISGRDGFALLKLFPYKAALLYDGGYSEVPPDCKNVSSLVVRCTMASLLVQAIDNLERRGASVTHWLGETETARVCHNEAVISDSQAQRDGALYRGITKVAEGLNDIFLGHKRQMARHIKKISHRKPSNPVL